MIPAIRHHFGKPTAYAYLPFHLSKQKQPAIGGLISSIKINCEFLAMDGWQIEGEQSSFGHDGCGGREYAKHLVSTTDLLRESRSSCHSRHTFPHISCIIRVSSYEGVAYIFLFDPAVGMMVREPSARLLGFCRTWADPMSLATKRGDHACIHLLGLRYSVSAK